jgi:hypothetical protein
VTTPHPEEDEMIATYTFDVFSSLDGYGAAGGDWTGYWGKRGPSYPTTAVPCMGCGSGGLRGQDLPALRADAGRKQRPNGLTE